MVDIHRK